MSGVPVYAKHSYIPECRRGDHVPRRQLQRRGATRALLRLPFWRWVDLRCSVDRPVKAPRMIDGDNSGAAGMVLHR